LSRAMARAAMKEESESESSTTSTSVRLPLASGVWVRSSALSLFSSIFICTQRAHRRVINNPKAQSIIADHLLPPSSTTSSLLQ
jgi:hypothetical protein